MALLARDQHRKPFQYPKLPASPYHNLRDSRTIAERTPSLVEYRNKSMTKMFGGPYNGTYVLAITIFSLGIIRDLMYVSLPLLKPSLTCISR